MEMKTTLMRHLEYEINAACANLKMTDDPDYARYVAAMEAADKCIAELGAWLSVSRDLNRDYVNALRKIADHKPIVGPNDSAEEAMAGYSLALSAVKQIARQALPITETQ